MSTYCNTVYGLIDIDAGIKGYSQKHRGEWTFTERKMEGDTHRALLLNLEELVPCAHEKEKVKYTNTVTLNNGPQAGVLYARNLYLCECGAEVEPAGFVEVKNETKS